MHKVRTSIHARIALVALLVTSLVGFGCDDTGSSRIACDGSDAAGKILVVVDSMPDCDVNLTVGESSGQTLLCRYTFDNQSSIDVYMELNSTQANPISKLTPEAEVIEAGRTDSSRPITFATASAGAEDTTFRVQVWSYDGGTRGAGICTSYIEYSFTVDPVAP